MSSYSELVVYKISKKLALEVDRIVKSLPKSERFGLGDQIYRSSRSVLANIAEGYGRKYHQKELIKHLNYALGSSDETQGHLSLIFDTSLIDRQKYPTLISDYKNLSVRIVNFINVIQKTSHS